MPHDLAKRWQLRPVDEATANLIIRTPASLSTIVNECPTCEHAHQQFTLAWKGGRFAETSRAWENEPYTAFYVVADALERRRIDALARPFIDAAIDPLIVKGIARSGKNGWNVQVHHLHHGPGVSP